MDNDQAIWDAYNSLLLGPDIERLRKLLTRYDLFRMTLDIPGDIVECGVFKGTGLLFWLKLLQIYAPGSNKRVIGLDMFTSFPVKAAAESDSVHNFLLETNFSGITTTEIYEKIAAVGIRSDRCDLLAGDISDTASAYVKERPGFRISLLHLDLDLEDATYAALEAFYPLVVRGGMIIFDEYGVANWTESNAVDRYFANKKIQLKTLSSARTPTAYLIKD